MEALKVATSALFTIARTNHRSNELDLILEVLAEALKVATSALFIIARTNHRSNELDLILEVQSPLHDAKPNGMKSLVQADASPLPPSSPAHKRSLLVKLILNRFDSKTARVYRRSNR